MASNPSLEAASNGRLRCLRLSFAAQTSAHAMIPELVQRYRVQALSAVLKRENVRSRRLLERPGFSLASPEQRVQHGVEPGELLMRRGVRGL